MPDSGLTQIGRYEVRERLGAGGMARVYKAWDTTLQRMVAIKILHEHLAEDPNFKERFEREARFVASFNHPNIVQVYDFDSLVRDGFTQYYMVMSYVPGHTMRAELDAAGGVGLPPARALQIARNLAAALGYAHERGMVHRDVKPGNVLIDDRNQAILTDFGIARLAQSTRLTQEGSSTGTPTYMSPEQAAGEAGDPRSDLYSLAVILWEMLIGQPPFDDEGSMAVMLKHLTADVPSYSTTAGVQSPALDQFFLRALAKNPADRYPTASALERAFTAALEGRVITEDDPPAQTPAAAASGPRQTGTNARTSSKALVTITQAARQNPRAISGVALLAVVLVTVLVVTLALGRVESRQSATPTPAVLATAQDGTVFFNSTFSPGQVENAYWPQQTDPPFTQQITPDGWYILAMELPFTAETTLFNGGRDYDNVLIFLEAELEDSSAPASAYGIVFRYQDADNYNVFAVDGAGRFSIWVREQGVWRELRDAEDGAWTSNPAVRPIGASNRLTLEVRGNAFAAYINNQPVVRISDDTLPPGRVGIYIASDDGPATVQVDEYRVRDSTSSMTGQ